MLSLFSLSNPSLSDSGLNIKGIKVILVYKTHCKNSLNALERMTFVTVIRINQYIYLIYPEKSVQCYFTS